MDVLKRCGILIAKMTTLNILLIQKWLNIFFKKLGMLVSRFPAWFIIGPIILSVVLSTGFFHMKFIDDPQYLYCSQNGKAWEWKATIDHYFPREKLRNYDYGRETRLISGYARVFTVARDGGSVLRREVLDEVAELDRLIKSFKISHKGKLLDYSQICARYFGKCTPNPLIHIYSKFDALERGDFKIDYPISLSNDKKDIYFYGFTLGGVQLDPENPNRVVNATAGQLLYFLDYSQPSMEEVIAKWEASLVHAMPFREWKHIHVYWLTSHSLLKEFVNAGFKSMPTFRVTVMVMIIFSMITCMMSDCVRSKPWLGAAGCVSALLAVAAGCGICMWLGIPFPPSNFTVPFVLLGIGIDDTFILLASWRNTQESKSVSERLVDAYVQSGVAITLTSLTNIASFLACALTPLPGLQIYGIYAAVACALTYLYQLTFIGGCLTYMGRAEARGLHATLPFLPVVPPSKAKNKHLLVRLFFTGSATHEGVETTKQLKEHPVMKFFKDKYGGFLSKTPVKIFVIFVFLIYFSIGLYGSFILEDGMEIKEFFPEDSYAYKFFVIDNKDFIKYPFRFQMAITEPLDYSDPKTQLMIRQNIKKIVDSPLFASEPLLTEFWLDYYLDFIEENKNSFMIRGYNLSSKVDFINCLRFVFFRVPQSERFKNDITFNSDYSEIIASRFFFQTYMTTDIGVGMKAFKLLEQFTVESPFKSTFYNPMAILGESFVLLRGVFISTVCYTILVMLIITLLFIPNIVVALWTTFSIISIEIGIMGYMVFWGLKLNAATLFGLIMYIGLSVDNAVHITCAYVTSPKQNPNERMKDALYHVAMPILQGCITTILGVFALYFLPSYIYQSIFKLGFLVMIFSAFHSIALVPVLLSIFCRKPIKQEDINYTSPMEKERLPTKDKEMIIIKYDDDIKAEKENNNLKVSSSEEKAQMTRLLGDKV